MAFNSSGDHKNQTRKGSFMKGKLIALIISLLFIPTFANAVGTVGSASVSSVDARPDGSHAVYISGATMPTSEGCTNNDRLVISPDDVGGKEMFAVATVAKLTSSKISFTVSGCVKVMTGSTATSPHAIRISLL